MENCCEEGIPELVTYHIAVKDQNQQDHEMGFENVHDSIYTDIHVHIYSSGIAGLNYQTAFNISMHFVIQTLSISYSVEGI